MKNWSSFQEELGLHMISNLSHVQPRERTITKEQLQETWFRNQEGPEETEALRQQLAAALAERDEMASQVASLRRVVISSPIQSEDFFESTAEDNQADFLDVFSSGLHEHNCELLDVMESQQ
jgi:hypothetical protein